MKIALINNLYKPYQRGGAERITEILSDQLKRLGHTVFIISTQPEVIKDNEEPGSYYLPSKYNSLNRFSVFYRLIWQMFNLVNIKKYKKLNKIFKTEKPDLIITNNLMGLGMLTPLAIKKNHLRHLHILHDIQLLHPSGLMYFGGEKIIDSLTAKGYQLIVNFLFNLGSRELIIISPSHWLLELHRSHKLFKNKQAQVIANPFIKNHNSVSKNNPNSFIFIGQLEKHKGVDLFVEAASRFADYDFLIVGSGSLKIESTNNLKVLGSKSSAEVNQLLTNSLAAIIPSRCYENSPTVIYEAAAVNTPVIAANLGGIPELIEKFGGLLFEPDNLDSLIMAITHFLKKGVELKDLPPSEDKEEYANKILSLL